jgi:hypothetical protein
MSYLPAKTNFLQTKHNLFIQNKTTSGNHASITHKLFKGIAFIESPAKSKFFRAGTGERAL